MTSRLVEILIEVRDQHKKFAGFARRTGTIALAIREEARIEAIDEAISIIEGTDDRFKRNHQ